MSDRQTFQATARNVVERLGDVADRAEQLEILGRKLELVEDEPLTPTVFVMSRAARSDAVELEVPSLPTERAGVAKFPAEILSTLAGIASPGIDRLKRDGMDEGN